MEKYIIDYLEKADFKHTKINNEQSIKKIYDLYFSGIEGECETGEEFLHFGIYYEINKNLGKMKKYYKLAIDKGNSYAKCKLNDYYERKYSDYEKENKNSSEDLIVLFSAGILGYVFEKYSFEPFSFVPFIGGGMGGTVCCGIGNTIKGTFGGRKGIFGEEKTTLILNFLNSVTGETHQTNWKISIMTGIGGCLGGEAGISIGNYLGETIGYKFPILRTIIGSGIGGIIGGKLGEFLFTSPEKEEDLH